MGLASLAIQLSPRIPYLFLMSCRITGESLWPLSLLCRFWESELLPSCLHSKLFIHWAFSEAPTLLLFLSDYLICHIIVQVILFTNTHLIPSLPCLRSSLILQSLSITSRLLVSQKRPLEIYTGIPYWTASSFTSLEKMGKMNASRKNLKDAEESYYTCRSTVCWILQKTYGIWEMVVNYHELNYKLIHHYQM